MVWRLSWRWGVAGAGSKASDMKHLIRALTGIAAAVLAYKYLFPAIATETLTSLHQLGFSVCVGAAVILIPYADWRLMIK